MNKKIQTAYAVVVIAAALLLGWWLVKNKSASQKAVPAASTSAKDESPMAKGQTGGNTWEGKLLASDSAKKGNLMLQTQERNIYFKTSRDFSALIGKDVVVSYEGNVNGFVLGNIVAK